LNNRYTLIIIGAGPAGLSAASRAAENGVSYLLLEAASQPLNTLFHYPKGKQVMDEPAILPLRADLPFIASSREEIIASWLRQIKIRKINLLCNQTVVSITGKLGDFQLNTQDGLQFFAEKIIFALGTQGNLRHLPIRGGQLPLVDYQLPDAKAYQNETIVVVGAGDSAIEDALALAEQNQVIIINRREEFNRANPSNLAAVLQAIENEEIECYYSTTAEKIQNTPEADKPLLFQVKTPAGPANITCNRVIARLGAVLPRHFLHACGIQFRSLEANALPAINEHYESSVAGIYIIGALSGYPLIKQALNQGYEVVEHVLGHPIKPADESLLREKFNVLPVFHSVTGVLRLVKSVTPLFARLTLLQLREFLLDSQLLSPAPDEVIFERDDYSNTFFTVLAGEVHMSINPDQPRQIVTLRQGQFFGEMSLISGRRRSTTVYAGAGEQCILIETPRYAILKLIHSVSHVRETIDRVFMLRAIQTHIAPEIPASDLAAVVQSAQLQHLSAGDTLFAEGDAGDCIYLIRSGSVKVLRHIGGNEITLAYLPAGHYIGEVGLLNDMPRESTVRAAVTCEVIRLEGDAFKALLSRSQTLRHQVEAKYQRALAQNATMESRPQAGNIIAFLVSQGLGEATDVLLIDEALCIQCNQCEAACAASHQGASRLDREAGPTFASIHVPTSCRHCEHPHCMKDCPPDAIYRSKNGEVVISNSCIGCGRCQDNCPYGVIQMAQTQTQKNTQAWWWWLLFGYHRKPALVENPELKAVKCDMCKDLAGGPACVRTCPTGAALRVSSEEFMSLVI
jgi:CRP-like cAMP-binding protein/Fe-S-cluster-containing hydrogenase component 2/thioredoxin reductase